MTHDGDLVLFSSRSEVAFYRWGQFVVRQRWLAIALPVLLSGYMLTFLPLLVIDNSTDAYLRDDDPAQTQYERFRGEFGRDDRVVVALAPDDVFDPAFLEKLRAFHRAIEDEVPYVDEVTSLFNARETRGEGDTLIVEGLLEGWLEAWPEDTSSLATLRARVLANPLYVHALVSEDATLTTLTIEPFTYSPVAETDVLGGFGAGAGDPAAAAEFLGAEETHALMQALRAVIERFESDSFPVHVTGPPAISDAINTALAHDLGVSFGAGAVIILLLLYVLFRRIAGAVLPMLVVLLSVVVSIGVMIALDIPGSTAVQILPVFLLTVGVCGAVHILAIVYRRIDGGDARPEAIAYAIGHSGLAIVMTSLTTAAGMVSFISAQMAPIAQLGTIAPIGVLLALVYTLVLLPGLLAVLPLRPARSRGGADAGGGRGLAGYLVRRLVALGDAVTIRPYAVLACAAVFVAAFGYGASQVRFAHYAFDWFEDSSKIKQSGLLLDEKLRGTMSLEVVVDTHEVNGLYEPATLERIDGFMRWAEAVEAGDLFVGKATSIVDIVKETHQALSENRAEARAIPQDRALVAQELLLFENSGSEDMEQWVDSEFSRARISLRAPFVDAMKYDAFVDVLEGGAIERFGPDFDVEITGFMPLLSGVMSAVIVSMGRSYVIALLVITPLMFLLLRDVKLGLLAMVPNLIPVVFVLGLMGFLDIPLDGTTIMIGAMVIGLAVDDTIHFMHKFRIYYGASGNAREAVRETLSTTGAALLFTTLVLASGFGVFAFASMVNTQNFGILAGSAALVAFVADIVVAPALMVLATRDRAARPLQGAGPLEIGAASEVRSVSSR